MEKLLLRPTEAALVLGIGRSKCYALIAAGILPSIRLGNSIRVPADELRRWVADQAAGGEPTGGFVGNSPAARAHPREV